MLVLLVRSSRVLRRRSARRWLRPCPLRSRCAPRSALFWRTWRQRRRPEAARDPPPAVEGRASAENHRRDEQVRRRKFSPWWEYRDRFLTEQRIREGTILDRASRDARAHRERARRPARIPGRHHRRRDLLRPHHRQLSRARFARDARLRLSAARGFLPLGARSNSCCWRARRSSIR